MKSKILTSDCFGADCVWTQRDIHVQSVSLIREIDAHYNWHAWDTIVQNSWIHYFRYQFWKLTIFLFSSIKDHYALAARTGERHRAVAWLSSNRNRSVNQEPSWHVDA